LSIHRDKCEIELMLPQQPKRPGHTTDKNEAAIRYIVGQRLIHVSFLGRHGTAKPGFINAIRIDIRDLDEIADYINLHEGEKPAL
jgi:hypothetical protein